MTTRIVTVEQVITKITLTGYNDIQNNNSNVKANNTSISILTDLHKRIVSEYRTMPDG